MRRILLFCGAVMAASPAAALDMCAELWFTRNLVFDRAGYCFGSVLGQVVFDNRDCRTTQPALTSSDKRLVSRMQAAEREWACNVDTDRTLLNVPSWEQRKQMVDLPVPFEGESACIGWRGRSVPLLAARRAGARVTGEITPGAILIYQHEATDGWDFVQIVEDGQIIGMGWVSLPVPAAMCDSVAG
ncbi:DUF4453 domain-containing protein [Actibacterium sp. 188UL27-1]|uniref:DUF4453 domain-containing protein n=1 Tax=Actibacterium sp. 188UL27-1 TaxID=2786961 RepID=UPI00195809BA|nr:DUF4453 domain-containing protein [Actibacterium sp. 188UL27-1]MBM7067911.1 DUF4453 domain-containing protein [Actibacterium sp. 188UL27-1]